MRRVSRSISTSRSEGCPSSVCEAAGRGRQARPSSTTSGRSATARSPGSFGRDATGERRDRASPSETRLPGASTSSTCRPFGTFLRAGWSRSEGCSRRHQEIAPARRAFRARSAMPRGFWRRKPEHPSADHRCLRRSARCTTGLLINTKAVSLETLYELVTLDVKVDGQSIPLQDLGTGHQSALIIHLFRQFGEVTEGDTLFLFEEPGNHLHPSTIRPSGTTSGSCRPRRRRRCSSRHIRRSSSVTSASTISTRSR